MRPTPTLLISDGDPEVLATLSRFAHLHGMAVIRDQDSKVRALARLQPDVILLDLNQRVSGQKLLADLKADPDTRHIPVVVMTKEGDQSARTLCLRMGAIEFVQKPFDASFMARVSHLALLCSEVRS